MSDQDFCVSKKHSSVLNRNVGCCEPTGLEITPNELYFGAMVIGETSTPTQTVTVKNIGKAVVRIESISITKGAGLFEIVAPNSYPELLDPDQTFDVEVRFNIANIGQVLGILEIRTNEDRLPYAVGISGRLIGSNVISAVYDYFNAKLLEERWAWATALGAEAGYRLTLEASLRDEIESRVMVEYIARVTALEAEASARLAMGVSIREDVTGQILEERYLYASADEALGHRIDTLELTFDGDFSEVYAAIQDEVNARVTAIGAEANRVNSILLGYSTTPQMNSAISTVVNAAITSEESARVSAIAAEASRVDTLLLNYATTGSVNTTVSAAITAESSARTSAIGAEATRVDSLLLNYSTTSGMNSAISTAVSAEATNRTNAITNAIAAEVTRVDNLLASYSTTGTTNAAITAAVANEASIRVSADGALSGRISVTESQFTGNIGSGLKTLIDNKRTNLALIDWWKYGAAIPWEINGGQENHIYSLPSFWPPLMGPSGGSEDVWIARADASGQNAGGWNDGQIAPLDPDKTYRFIIPIMPLGVVALRSSFWGISGVCDLNSQNPNANPYFASSSNLTPDRWYLFVGYVFPRNSNFKTNAGAGIWDTEIGEQISTGLNFCFHPDGRQITHRAYQYYATDGAYQAFGRPLIECVDGSESNFISALKGIKEGRTANARVTDEINTRSNAIAAEASRVDALLTNYATTGVVNAAINAEITNRNNAISSAVGAVASRASTLEAQMRRETPSDLNNAIIFVDGRVTTEESARVSAIAAEASRIDSVLANYYSTTSSMNAAINTAVQAEANARGVLASTVTTVSGVANGAASTASSALSIANGADGKANTALARAAVTLDVNNYITGWEMNNNGSSGSFTVRTDTFSIVSPGGGLGLQYSGGNLRTYHPNGQLCTRMGNW